MWLLALVHPEAKVIQAFYVDQSNVCLLSSSLFSFISPKRFLLRSTNWLSLFIRSDSLTFKLRQVWKSSNLGCNVHLSCLQLFFLWREPNSEAEDSILPANHRWSKVSQGIHGKSGLPGIPGFGRCLMLPNSAFDYEKSVFSLEGLYLCLTNILIKQDYISCSRCNMHIVLKPLDSLFFNRIRI